jgi:hypothetical protein
VPSRLEGDDDAGVADSLREPVVPLARAGVLGGATGGVCRRALPPLVAHDRHQRNRPRLERSRAAQVRLHLGSDVPARPTPEPAKARLAGQPPHEVRPAALAAADIAHVGPPGRLARVDVPALAAERIGGSGVGAARVDARQRASNRAGGTGRAPAGRRVLSRDRRDTRHGAGARGGRLRGHGVRIHIRKRLRECARGRAGRSEQPTDAHQRTRQRQVGTANGRQRLGLSPWFPAWVPSQTCRSSPPGGRTMPGICHG